MAFKRLVIVVGVGISAAALWALSRYLGQLDLRAVLTEMRHFSAARFAAALLLVLGYLLINAFNEVIVCRALQQQLGIARPMNIAAIANSIGHSVGFATLSAGALRMRMYGALGIDAKTIASIIALGTLPFLLGAACLIAIAMIAHPVQAAVALKLPSWLVVGIAGAAFVALFGVIGMTPGHRRSFAIGKLRLPLPSSRFLLIELLMGVAEVILVASVLYLFIPSGTLLSYLNFIGIYLIAIMLGQLSNTPAGIGVFEAALLTLLPSVPPPQLLAAIIGYRVAFEVVPLILALGLLLAFEVSSRSGVLGRLWRTRAAEK